MVSSSEQARALYQVVSSGSCAEVKVLVRRLAEAGSLEQALVHAASNLDVAAGRQVWDRLSATLAYLPEGGEHEAPPGMVVVAAPTAEETDVARRLWTRVLRIRGYDVRSWSERTVPDFVDHLQTTSPAAILLYVPTVTARSSVEELIEQLRSNHLQIPLLLAGSGVDHPWAQQLAVPTGIRDPYWGGIHVCGDPFEADQVLRHVVLFEPPPMEHTHDDDPGPTASGCTSCTDCGLVMACPDVGDMDTQAPVYEEG